MPLHVQTWSFHCWYCPIHICIDLFRLTWSDITVLMLMSMSLYLAPLFPSYLLLHQSTTWPLRAIIAVYKVHEHASISIDSLCIIIGHLHDYRVSLELLWNDFAVSSVDLLNNISQLKPMLGRIYTSLAFVCLSTAWLALAIGDPWEKKAGHCNSVERDCF